MAGKKTAACWMCVFSLDMLLSIAVAQLGQRFARPRAWTTICPSQALPSQRAPQAPQPAQRAGGLRGSRAESGTGRGILSSAGVALGVSVLAAVRKQETTGSLARLGPR